jgi:hypothetical protein
LGWKILYFIFVVKNLAVIAAAAAAVTPPHTSSVARATLPSLTHGLCD